MSWIVLLVAGVFEVVWAMGLSWTEGFTRPLPSVLVLIASVVSAALLAVAVREIPVGVGYAVWVAIGVIGTSAVGWLWLGEPMTPSRALFLSMILAGVIGLKVTTPAHGEAEPEDATAP